MNDAGRCQAEYGTAGEAGRRLATVATRVPPERVDRLRWLAYRGRTTVSAIASRYIEEGLEKEDFTGYSPPD